MTTPETPAAPAAQQNLVEPTGVDTAAPVPNGGANAFATKEDAALDEFLQGALAQHGLADDGNDEPAVAAAEAAKQGQTGATGTAKQPAKQGATGATAAAGQTGATGATTDSKQEEEIDLLADDAAPKQSPQENAYHARLRSRREQQEKLSEWQKKEQWYQDEMYRQQQQLQQATQRFNLAQEAMQKGDINAAIKASLGVENFEALQQTWLEHKGQAQRSSDPRVSQLEQELAQFRQQQQEQMRVWQQQQAEQRAEQQRQEDLQIAREELKTSRIKYLPELAEVEGFTDTYKRIADEHSDRDPKENMAAALRVYHQGYQTLHRIFGGASAAPINTASPQKGSPLQQGVTAGSQTAATSASPPNGGSPEQPGASATGGTTVPQHLSLANSTDVTPNGGRKAMSDDQEIDALIRQHTALAASG